MNLCRDVLVVLSGPTGSVVDWSAPIVDGSLICVCGDELCLFGGAGVYSGAGAGVSVGFERGAFFFRQPDFYAGVEEDAYGDDDQSDSYYSCDGWA